MTRDGKATLHFMDGTRLVIRYLRLAGKHSLALAERVRKALRADRLAVQVGASLLVVTVRNLKYLEISPAPDALPVDVVRDAELVEPARQ